MNSCLTLSPSLIPRLPLLRLPTTRSSKNDKSRLALESPLGHHGHLLDTPGLLPGPLGPLGHPLATLGHRQATPGLLLDTRGPVVTAGLTAGLTATVLDIRPALFHTS